jgi:hypothetical protein
MIMNKFVVAAATAALFAGTALSTAQTQDTEGTGAQEEIIKKPNANSATQAAPGQKQNSGDADSAQEVAPGQQQKAGEADAQDAAPGQVKKEDQATGEQQQQDKSASENAPGQMEKSGEADRAQEAAPGRQKTGEADAQDAAPGQVKKEEQAGSETKQAPGQQEQQIGESEQQPSNETTGSINISTEQKTEITQVFREVKSEPVDVDFEVNVGVAVPRTVTLRPLPPRVIEIVPDYRGYEYFVLADGRIIIVEPGTLEIVYVLVV